MGGSDVIFSDHLEIEAFGPLLLIAKSSWHQDMIDCLGNPVRLEPGMAYLSE
jgi:hypothetical protein